jgi:hypothetical protein
MKFWLELGTNLWVMVEELSIVSSCFFLSNYHFVLQIPNHVHNSTILVILLEQNIKGQSQYITVFCDLYCWLSTDPEKEGDSLSQCQ